MTVGIGDNPLLAKLALDNEAKHQDSGIAEWRYEGVPETIWKIKQLDDVCGIGNRTAERLKKMGIFSMYQLSQTPPTLLKRAMGVMGEQLYYHAHGLDYSRLNEKHVLVSKSYGKSHVDTAVIHLSIGYSKYSIKKGFSHQMKIPATNSSQVLINYFLQLFVRLLYLVVELH